MKRLMMLLVAGILLVPVMGWTYTVPTGFTQIRSAPGVHLYQNGSDFVQVIQQNLGARVKLLHSPVTNIGDPGFRYVERQSLEDVWSGFSGGHTNAFSVTNGAFFSAGDCNVYTNVGIAFTVKNSGDPTIPSDQNGMLAYGYANNSEYVGQKLVWKILENESIINNFDDNWQSLLSSAAPEAIVGLVENADKGPLNQVGRTFVGCGDLNANNRYNTSFIFTSSTSTQAHAAQVLRNFGAAQVMMLDGGGSTQAICQGADYPDACRAIPQTIGVLAADVTPPTAPTNLSVNPSGCSQTNSFTFDWTNSIDTGGSGLVGYEWNLDGSQNVNPVSSKPFTASAPATGSYTFFVRAYDGAGNRSGFGQIGFCYQPPSGPCGTRQIIGCTNPPHPIIPPATQQPVPNDNQK